LKKIIFVFSVLIVIFVLSALSGVVYIVDETDYVIQTRLSKVSKVISTQSFRVWAKIPFVHEVFTYPAKIQTYDAPEESIVTKDKKTLIVDNYFKWKIIDTSLTTFRNKVQTVERANSRLVGIVHDAVKDVMGQYNLTEIVSGKQKEVLESSLQQANAKAISNIGAVIVDIHFKKVQLPLSNEARVYERMKSERSKEAEFYRARGKEDSIRIVAETDRKAQIIDAEAYKEAQTIRGKAEALSTEIYSKAFSQDPEFYAFWRTLETYRKIMDTSTTLVLSPSSELYKYLSGD